MVRNLLPDQRMEVCHKKGALLVECSEVELLLIFVDVVGDFEQAVGEHSASDFGPVRQIGGAVDFECLS